MIVKMWMSRDVIALPPDATILEGATLMTKRRIRRLLVATAQPQGLHLIGIVSSGDLIRACAPEINPFSALVTENKITTRPLSEVMKTEPWTTHPEAPIEEAAGLMRDQKVSALPVLQDHHLVGIITESDIFRAFVGLFATTEAGVRITFDMSEGEDVFRLINEAARRRRLQVVSLISAHQDNRPVCVVRLTGSDIDGLMDELWASGHRVVNVLRFSGKK